MLSRDLMLLVIAPDDVVCYPSSIVQSIRTHGVV